MTIRVAIRVKSIPAWVRKISLVDAQRFSLIGVGIDEDNSQLRTEPFGNMDDVPFFLDLQVVRELRELEHPAGIVLERRRTF